MIMGAELLAYGMANDVAQLDEKSYLEVVSTEALTPRGQKESEGVMIHTPVEQPLPVVRVGEIQSQENAQRWLVEGLWGASSVGVIGGAPKCAKTWLGLDMALSVATGTACLGKYAVPEPGPVWSTWPKTRSWSCANASRAWPGIAVSISPESRST